MTNIARDLLYLPTCLPTLLSADNVYKGRVDIPRHVGGVPTHIDHRRSLVQQSDQLLPSLPYGILDIAGGCLVTREISREADTESG